MKRNNSAEEFHVLIGMIIVLAVAFALALLTIKEPRQLFTDLSANPLPLPASP